MKKRVLLFVCLYGIWASFSHGADFNVDNQVSLDDFAIFSRAWRSQSGETNYNSSCDMSASLENGIGLDDLVLFSASFINMQDLDVPHNIALIYAATEDIAQGMPYSQALNNMLCYDAFWSAKAIAKRQPEVWQTLRTEYPERLCMLYTSSCTVFKDDSINYLDYNYIEKYHPEWFLLMDETNAVPSDYRDPEKRIRWSTDPTSNNYNRFFLDVGNPDFQAWASNEFLKKLNPETGVSAGVPYSGLLAENVSLSNLAYYWRRIYPNWKYAAFPPDWSRNFCLYLDRVKSTLNSQGQILIVNGSVSYESTSSRIKADFIDLLDSVDGVGKECALGLSSRELTGGDNWLRSLANHEEVLNNGLYDWWVYDPKMDEPIEDHQRFLYVYCSFLLVKDTRRSFFGTHYSQSVPWYNEYNLPLGIPVSLRYQSQDCWVRNYQFGLVVVNPSSTSKTFETDSIYNLDCRTQKKVTQLTLDPLSATILLPSGFFSNESFNQ